MLRKLKDFFGIVEGRKAAVACKLCRFFNGSVACCHYQRSRRSTFFHPIDGYIVTSFSTARPYVENRYGRCIYFEARREAVPGPSGVVCTPHKGGGFDLEIRKAELEEALGGPVHSATEVEGKKPYPYFREKEARHER